MIAKLEDKTIAVLEMVLDVIQMYSKDLVSHRNTSNYVL